ncbi:four helix bundle protein [Dolichospermum planctonicum CS-1226]|uniref:Four helix bundle protein n=1 Tax=Dolichospermum planctonicum CS-1226 TaxID=3021751 RepID=A0ABT5ADZ1_9CYAN|nr:four helix bundle protein [Dolichospermum planctonicum]MDB9535003.1 four helix bundle protein [Dolichospermum planctonicum CS-1226]
MAKSNFENLQVYQLAEKLADDIWNIVLHGEEFPKATIGKQIVRSVDSIGANNETRHCLRQAYKRNLLTNEEVNKLKPIIEELSPKLTAYLNSIGNLSGKKSDN